MATPTSYSISLSRLLSRLESSLGDPEKLSALNEVDLRKAAANIDNARKLVIELERSQGPGKPDSATIAQQRSRILYLHDQVIQAQQNLTNISEPEAESSAESATEPQINETTNEPTAVLRDRLFANREGKQDVTNTSTEHVLQHHRMLQDDLSDAMLGMARGLKERSLAFGEALREDSKLIENAETMLSKNVDKMGRTGGRLQLYSRESRVTIWFILGAIIAVFLAWLVMYFIIRLT